jgi:hypothetical protein
MLLGKLPRLFRLGGAGAGTARFHEVDAVVEFALFAGVEGFHRAVVAHDARINGAAGTVLCVFA